MTLKFGTRIGSFQVGDPIGKGGMGEVYRARDSRLVREVAIKVVPAEFAADPERRARLEREARLLAAFSHPNIAAIHGLEHHEDALCLILEMVEGETLADRIQRGAMPPGDALRLALQIAEGLEAAHAKGVIHRDLKPANIKVTPEGRVKILDFGLAKAFGEPPGNAHLSHSPTLSLEATAQGVILGTAAYMSPEQARGENADKRADVWAFGCVLFEMLTGKGAFGGKSVSDILAGVLRAEPDWQTLPAKLHPRIRLLLERCLEKDADNRYHDVADARVDIQQVLADPAGVLVEPEPEVAARRSIVPWVGALVLAAVTGVAVWALGRVAPPQPGIVSRFVVSEPDGAPVITTYGWRVVAISPDGSTIAYSASTNNGRQVYIRRMGELEATPLRGTEDAGTTPFFSFDGRSVGFIGGSAGTSLRRVSVLGGPEVTIVNLPGQPYRMSWGPDDTILFGRDGQPGLLRIPAVGGEVEQLTTPDAEAGEGQHTAGMLLPDGDTILFTIDYTSRDSELALFSLSTREISKLGIVGASPTYVPTGHIIYAVSDGTIRAVPFDIDRGAVTDTNPTPIVEGLHTGTNPNFVTGNYAVASNGTLVYLSGAPSLAPTGRVRETGLVWVDRRGNEEPIPVEPDDYTMARVSPDGSMIALVVGDGIPANGSLPPDIWIYDVEPETLRRLTFDDDISEDGPLWSNDSTRIFYRSGVRTGAGAVYSIPAEGGEPELVFQSPNAPAILPWSLSPDGATLAAVNAVSLTDANIASISLDDEPQLTQLLTDETRVESEPVISPDGRWVAYQESASPTSEGQQIMFRPFPDLGRQMFPVGPGASPMFSADGSELFYFDGTGISSRQIVYEPRLRWSAAQKLFERAYWYGVAGPMGEFGRAWDWDRVNGRFVMIEATDVVDTDSDDDDSDIIVVLNWIEELRQLVPTP